jgi:hypothetical protein
MESCLAAQKRFLLFKGLGSFKQFLKIGLSIDTTHNSPLPGHFTVLLILNKNTHKRLTKPARSSDHKKVHTI